MCNYGVLTTGFDAPRTSAAVIGRPTLSLVLYSQMIGRALRGPKAGGNKYAEIVTAVDPEFPGFGKVEKAFRNWGMFGNGGSTDEVVKFSRHVRVARAMRDSGYKNTAFALAELIDNSVQANAKIVEVIGIEETQLINQRQRRRLKSLAVLDNGDGMDSGALWASLSFGNGTHLDDRSGIGRFGMGLPNASFSQAKRVEVWSWQNGPTNALHTYLDLDEIAQGKQTNVPKPSLKSVPKIWHKRAGHKLGDTGTLVVWPNLDEERVTWKQAKVTYKHTEDIVGRIYRRFLNNNKVRIRLVAYKEEASISDHFVRANDPMYLMNSYINARSI